MAPKSFRPRWAMHPTMSTKPQDLEWPVTVPDVVFSLRLPASSTPKLGDARRYHPAYFFSAEESSSRDIDIPILVVEYNKLKDEECKDDDEEDRPHRTHLTAGMTAALHLYAALGLATPLCGIFMNKYAAHLFLGTPKKERGRTLPIIQEITTNPDMPFDRLDLLHNLLHVLHLRTILSNMRAIAKSIVDELSSNANTLLESYKWVDSGRDFKQQGIEVRRQIDSTRPPLVVDDVVLRFLFLTERDYIASWLQKANITFLAKEPLREAPIHIRLWMQPFDRRAQLSSPLLSEAIEDSKKVLPGRGHGLVAPFLSSIQSSACSSVSGGPETNVDVSSLSSDILSALTFCMYARDISQGPEALTTHWVALYNSLFSRAWRSFEAKAVLPRWYPQWNVHRSLRDPGPGFENNLQEIHPNFAFIFCLHNERAIMSKHKGPRNAIEDLLPNSR
ncbi:hypothetical protein BDZ89DRAFT_259891 [Hymenopellis radicata]|nr:hypothetical protein BDZ89DRAFT_259891 [Hymenopellis radicata]